MNKFLKHPEPSESDLKGPHYWKSLDELAETDGFKNYLHREFPDFLTLVIFSVVEGQAVSNTNAPPNILVNIKFVFFIFFFANLYFFSSII